MKPTDPSRKSPDNLEDLGRRLSEAEETFAGEVDAVVLGDGRVYSLPEAQEALRAAEEAIDLREGALDEVSQGAMIGDSDGRLIYVNAGFERLTGYRSDEVLGRTGGFLQGAETSPDTIETLRRAIRSGQFFEGEVLNYRKDGTPFWNLLTISPVRDKADRLVRFVAIQQDVTQRRATEDKLREREEHYRLIFEQTPIGKTMANLDFTFVRANAAFCRLTGYSADELMRLDFPAITHPDDLPRDLELAARLTTGEIDTYEMDKRYIRKDGSWVWVNLSVCMLRDAAGRPQGYLASAINIDERRQAEDTLQANAELLRMASRTAQLGHWAIEFPGPKLFWSEEVRRIHEVEPNYEPTYEAALDFFPPSARRRLDEALAKGEAYDLELEFITAKGNRRWVRTTSAVEIDARGKKFYGIFQDVTAQREVVEKLHQREVLLRIAGRTARIGGWSVTLPEERFSWSEEVYALHEVPPDSAITFEQAIQFLAPEERGKMKAAFDACARNGTSFDLEVEIITARGNRIWARIIGFSERDERGAVCGVSGSFQDITKAKRAETSTRESEERAREISKQLAKVLDSMLDVICTFDAEGRFIQVSAACEKMWGYRPEELLGTHFVDLVHPEDIGKTRAVDAGIMSGNVVRNFENRYVRKDGTTVHILWSAWWSEADQSNFCVAHDITEARMAEAETREVTERLRLAVKASKVGIWDWNVVTGDIHWDEQMYAIYGEDPAHAPNGLEIWKNHLHPEDKERAQVELEAVLEADGSPDGFSFRIVVPAPDGDIRHVRGERLFFRDAAGRAVRVLGTNWDVTAQVQREEALRQKLEEEKILRRQASAGEKAKSEFLAVMSHEIRTPMNGILGFAEMLAQSPTLTPENRDISETILSSGEIMLRILDDILDFSRMEAGRLSIEKQVFSPRELVHGIKALYASQIQRKGLEFEVSMDGDLPKYFLGDVGRIRQILVNLIGNAWKFTEHGLIRMDVNLSAGASGRPVLQFVVQDTGPGIDPERAQVIFESFTQEDSSISRRYGGTGLGLAISRRLAELMEGTLLACSQPGEGSTFTLRVPLENADAPKDHAATEGAPALTFEPDFAARYPLRILAVDDDRVNLKLIRNQLRRLGYDASVASNGVEAVAIYKQEKPDCILMDMQMPKMDGIEATRRIRALEAKDSIPAAYISALTANIVPEHRQQCFETGMNAYLNKPIKVQAIIDVLIKAVSFRLGRK